MLDACQECLGGQAMLDEGMRTRLSEFLGLICEWNEYSGLVSRNESGPTLWGHVADSLAVLPGLGEGPLRMLDVGTGGGFPAIVLKLVRPDIQLVCVERSEKKVAFLRKAESVLGLSGLDLRLGDFPGLVSGENFDVITARAVEQPRKLAINLLEFVRMGMIHLCQIEEIALIAKQKPELFHVEQFSDTWDEMGLRRGRLYRIIPRDA